MICDFIKVYLCLEYCYNVLIKDFIVVIVLIEIFYIIVK